MPFPVLAPSLLATFVYVFVFTGWTIYISVSDSTLLPTYRCVGLKRTWRCGAAGAGRSPIRTSFSSASSMSSSGVGLVLAIRI